MGQPYVGEIRMFGGNFAPVGWMTCDGQLLAIAENEILFQAIGTTYGGDGQSTFALPNLSGRVPVHMGTGSSGTIYTIGEMAGVQTVTLTTSQIPAHNHAFLASGNTAGDNDPTNKTVGQVGATQIYHAANPTSAMAATSLQPAGGSQPHDNMQPYLALTFIISLFGLFPTPT